ncbi:hypothetical protein CHLRE_17g723750v5 [Chlamydomonas reinhardtii]|uniref:Uncharacterized protein n=1 Tax=Chlamydomonas reinhardtii TaxID=3055 RepID=A0A2K3CQG7_CHLRE|nr:uncharacterized protein CHLRE_17g723750v5 [Chlamydomonas reinhardtii]PNW70529.1 hypothetical protein CHLRE_17g723750v5 [Chlamydomonas reinhardtii]
MVNALAITTGVLAIVGVAPWLIYLGALAKITDVVTNGQWSQAQEQTVIMLEWYTVAAQFVNLVILAVCSFVPHAMKRTHSMFSNWFAVNTALIIYRTTLRIVDLNQIQDGANPGNIIDEGRCREVCDG